MHVPDGFLSPLITLPALGAAAPLWIVAARRRFGRQSGAALPVMGSLTAVAFVVQSLMIPVPGGTSTHLGGVTLLALLFGPLAAFACETLVLLVQALFFGAGGLTGLGVNALALGLVGPLFGYGVYRLVRPLSERVAAFFAAYLATQGSTLAVAGTFALQHALAPEHLPIGAAASLTVMMAPSLLVTGVLEGGYTALALALLRRSALAREL